VFITLSLGNTSRNCYERKISMSEHKSTEQETNIKKMNEVLEEKNKENSQKQNFDQEDKKAQSLKDSEHTPDENNILVETKNNRMP
jgi:hypothetical protein